MNNFRTLIATAALCAAGLSPALAQTNALTNGDFTNNLTNWDSYGDVTVIGPSKRVALSTASNILPNVIYTPEELERFDDDMLGVGFNNNSGTSAVDLSFAPNLAGVSQSTLDGLAGGSSATEGSAIRQSFSANAGDLVTVSFTWAFLSLETTASDFAFVALNDSAWKIADATSAPNASVFLGTFGDLNFVDWSWNDNTYSYYANSSGIQSFALGIVDTLDYTLTSELRVDNISILVTAVPEPETYAMLLAGLGLVGTFTRRRKSQAQA